MHLLAVLLTSNAALIDALENPRFDVPANVLENAHADSAHQLDIVAFNPDRRQETFADFLGETIGLVDNRLTDLTYDGLVVLYSRDSAGHVAQIRDGIFATDFDGHDYIENRNNFLVRSFGRLVKNLLTLAETMRDKTRMEAAILPAKNFDSKVFKAFLSICQNEAGAAEFQNRVVPALTAVTRLRGPKRRSTYPTKYFKDEQPACFQYGHEKHSSFETGGDHLASCSIRGLFRMGVPLEQQRHFNVTSDEDQTLISGQYDTCHDARITVAKATHLNMFSNDFWK